MEPLRIEVEHDGGRVVARVPYVPGAEVEGRTEAEAIRKAKAAALRGLAGMVEAGEEEPEPVRVLFEGAGLPGVDDYQGELTAANRVTGRMREMGCLGIVGAVVCAIGLFLGVQWLGRQIPQTVAHGERTAVGGANREFGYEVTRSRWNHSGYELHLWAGDRMEMRFASPNMELQRLKTQRWLAGERAVLLEVECIYRDSVPLYAEQALLYDFERGTLVVFGTGMEWLVPDYGRKVRRAVTREEFDKAVRELEGV